MKNIAILKKNAALRPLSLSYGRVTEREEDHYRVTTDEGIALWARKADGCLLTPEAEDMVLVSDGGAEGAFILSVLIKNGAEFDLALGGKAKIHAESITLSALHSASLEAPEVAFSGVSGKADFMGFSLRAGVCRAEIKKVSMLIQFLDSVVDRVTQRVKNSFRWIENTEQISAGRIRSVVKQRFSLKAKHTSILADEEVTVDGKKIHLG